jgi:hypothetical protein
MRTTRTRKKKKTGKTRSNPKPVDEFPEAQGLLQRHLLFIHAAKGVVRQSLRCFVFAGRPAARKLNRLFRFHTERSGGTIFGPPPSLDVFMVT